MTVPTPRERLDELFVKVDSFFERTRLRYPEGITCHSGCDDCCRKRFSVTTIEASVLVEALEALSGPVRDGLRRRAVDGDPSVCPALEDDGRCALYSARPLICRTHGLPIRFEREAGGRSLPMVSEVNVCPKNFGGEDLGGLDAASILNQTTLSTVLGALDAAFADSKGKPRGERIAIDKLLR